MDDIKEKIKSLIAKATDPAASAAEAEGAMMMARKLMAKFGVSEEDLSKMSEGDFRMYEAEGRRTKKGETAFHPVDKYLGHYLAQFCGCRKWTRRNDAVLTGGDKPDEVIYFGLESDVEFCLYLRDAWVKHFDYNWSIYKTMNPRLVDMVSARQSFSMAFAQGMRERLDQWQCMRGKETEDYEGVNANNALVLKRLDVVEAEMKRRGIVLGYGSGPANMGFNLAAAGAGAMAAKSASVGRGVGAGNIKAIGSR